MVALAAMGMGCGTSPAAPSDTLIRFHVSNHLLAPVAIRVDGVAYVNLSGGASTNVTVSREAQWLSWLSAKPMDFEGQPIRDDLSEVQVSLSGIDLQLDISNVVNGQTYITAQILNFTSAPVSIGVYNESSVTCAARLPAASGGTSAFTQIGYYRLLGTTEIRAYRDPSTCTGPYTAWSSSQIRDFSAKSGLVSLRLDSAP
jgi:hypothetical protein